MDFMESPLFQDSWFDRIKEQICIIKIFLYRYLNILKYTYFKAIHMHTNATKSAFLLSDSSKTQSNPITSIISYPTFWYLHETIIIIIIKTDSIKSCLLPIRVCLFDETKQHRKKIEICFNWNLWRRRRRRRRRRVNFWILNAR